MYIPSVFWGEYKEIKLRCRKRAKQFISGMSWEEAIDADNVCDTKSVSGLILLSDWDTSGSYYHCYAFTRALFDLSSPDNWRSIKEQVFEASLKSPWGLLGLLSHEVGSSFMSQPRKLLYKDDNFETCPDDDLLDAWRSSYAEPFLDKCLQYWDVLSDEKYHYSLSFGTSPSLWSIPSSLHYILANMGISTEKLRAPLPSGGLAELVALAKEMKS
jgi:hypothetical protein